MDNWKDINRPDIKGYFGEKVTLKQVHETYLSQPELFLYAQSLDRHIDKLESLIEKAIIEAKIEALQELRALRRERAIKFQKNITDDLILEKLEQLKKQA